MTPAEAPPSQSQQQQQHQEPLELPRNARIVSLIMQAMDVTDYQPAVLPQLMEFVHRYVLDVVADAQLFADHAGRTEIDADDVRLAVEAKMSHSFTGAPSKEVLASIAEAKNVAPLPVVNEKLGLRLPPERNALTGLNFQILPRVCTFHFRHKTGSIHALLNIPYSSLNLCCKRNPTLKTVYKKPLPPKLPPTRRHSSRFNRNNNFSNSNNSCPLVVHPYLSRSCLVEWVRR
ncbi:transcription initiation factor IID, 31kD subunit-domain-containing protein [Chytriomyces cf. hyalinus JEL632]|nr:transcription initiation factor IID, 31kD subunit-domain-containing protein [Chytriomyces cf. hyalinus JEL632]